MHYIHTYNLRRVRKKFPICTLISYLYPTLDNICLLATCDCQFASIYFRFALNLQKANVEFI